MNMRHIPCCFSFRLLMRLLLVLLLTGCATTPKIDWASRVGFYTHDQAILDFGPTDRAAKLADGTVVAEWLTRRGRTYSYPAYGYGWWHGWWPYYPGYYDSGSPDYFLRLTFDPDGKLKAWKKFAR